MSELLHLPGSECARAVGMLPQFVDGDLAAEQAAWLGAHLEACAECRAALAGFTKIDNELTGWGQSLSLQNPPPTDEREQLAARLASLPARRRSVRWMPAAAAAIAAALTIAVIAPHKKPVAVGREANSPFVEIPYLPPLDPHENSTIVRMNIRVATLIEAGYRVAADPDTIVPADVLVGEDGRAHAVRVLSGIEWNGTGD
jgi:predicted anti-sigma-YlaC factor YlaD